MTTQQRPAGPVGAAGRPRVDTMAAMSEPLDLRAEHRGLSERVTEVLRERILSGLLVPGTRLVERTVAEQLGVSRVPVRDAVNVLKGEGLVEPEGKRGVVVRGLTRADLTELFEVRTALEVLGARLAAQRVDEADLARLRALLAEAADALDALDQPRLDAANADFHEAIVELSRNDLLVATLRPLQGRLRWLLRQNDEPGSIHDQHHALYEALAARDPEAAAAVTAAHVRTSEALATRLLYRLESGD